MWIFSYAIQQLCDLFAVELDDSSHRQVERGQRDSFVESTLAAVDLPLVRVPVHNSYNIEELNILFKNALQRHKMQMASQKATNKVASSLDNHPRCPNCGSTMVLRTVQKGSNVGEKFWGCPNYPKCRAMLKI
jgi:rRNA maturation endonuclease Nob1